MTNLLLDSKLELLERIKNSKDINIPPMQYWNYNACPAHTEIGPQVDCKFQACGGDLFAHQRVAAAWLYAVERGLLADDPGVGKTNTILALIALLKEKNALTKRALIIPQTPSVTQWAHEITRWTKLKVVAVDGSIPKAKRISLYATTSWDILVVGSHCAISDKAQLVQRGPYDVVVTDDVDPLLNHDNATHQAIEQIARGATRSFTVNATALQMRLEQLHAALVPAGGHDIFGSLDAFKRRYVQTENVLVVENGKVSYTKKDTGYKHQTEFKRKFSSTYMRRRATDLDDIRMPELMPPVIEWLEMSAPQRARYTELQEGVLRLLREEGEQVKHLTALTQFTYGQQICAGLPALKEPDGPYASPKLDRLFHYMNTVWADRKVVVFAKNVGMVRAGLMRAQAQGIGAAVVWGQQKKDSRTEQIRRFREIDNVQLMFGTVSIERSLNLQVANTVVGLDLQLNPARVKQLLGRVQRAGSSHDHVYMFNFMMSNSQESRYQEVLMRRQALFDNTFDETSEIFESLPPLELLRLMQP